MKKFTWIILCLLISNVAVGEVIIDGQPLTSPVQLQDADSTDKQNLTNGAADTFVKPLKFLPDVANCVAITATSVQKTLPTTTNFFGACANGHEAYIRVGADPTATTEVGVGFHYRVPSGACRGPWEIIEDKAAVIGTSTSLGSSLCFLNFDNPT